MTKTIINYYKLINFHVPKYHTKHPVTMYVDITQTNYYLKSPIITMCKLYNKISDQYDIFNIDLSTFRKLVQDNLPFTL